MQGMENAYVENGVSKSEASTTVGIEVIKAVAQKYQTNNKIGKATIEIDGFGTVENVIGDATVSVYTTDFIVEGTIHKDAGQLTWGEIEDNVPGIKIINVPSFIAKDGFATLDVKRRDVSQDASVTWSSLTESYATVNSTTGKVTGVAEGTVRIKASVTDGGTTYTAECTIPVREIVMPQVGDFVNYDAGEWTTDANGKILIHYTDGSTETVDNSTNLPSSGFKFGGFTTTSGKNGNATPLNNSYNYVQEKKSTNETITTTAVTGWRIFDIDDNGVITLISAGCPEDYYHPQDIDYGYISEYILTGNDDDVPSNVNLSKYKIRDWTADYGDITKNITACVLTKSKLDDWYTTYITNGTLADTGKQATFQKIYNSNPNVINNGKYESLIDNYSYYWLSNEYYRNAIYNVDPYNKKVYR